MFSSVYCGVFGKKQKVARLKEIELAQMKFLNIKKGFS